MQRTKPTTRTRPATRKGASKRVSPSKRTSTQGPAERNKPTRRRSPSSKKTAARTSKPKSRAIAKNTPDRKRLDRWDEACLPIKAGEGLGVFLGTVEQVNGERDVTSAMECPIGNWLRAPKPKRSKVTKHFRTIGQSLAAIGHPTRLVLLETMLYGPAVYRTLQKITGMKPGPLYHHINQLRLASLIRPKKRDLYELTRAGRNLMLVAMALPEFLKDKRARPFPNSGP